MIHFYCLAVEACFYSHMVVECLPVDPATWVRFPAGAVNLLYDNGAQRWAPFCSQCSVGHNKADLNVYIYLLV